MLRLYIKYFQEVQSSLVTGCLDLDSQEDAKGRVLCQNNKLICHKQFLILLISKILEFVDNLSPLSSFVILFFIFYFKK